MSIDTSDGFQGPFVTGFIDPAESTGSDLETAPVERDEYVPVAQRFDRNRIVRKGAYWFLLSPIGKPHFEWPGGRPTNVSEPYATYPIAVAAFRKESALAKAKSDNNEIKARLYRGDCS